MDPFAALKSEIFRPLASVVLPGTLAIAPFAILAGNAFPEVERFFVSQPGWFLGALAGTGAVVGMLLENVGSGIERGIDRCIELEYLPGHSAVWERYLGSKAADTNGRRYLSGIVTRLKFLNSMMPALFLFWTGGLLLQLQASPFSPGQFLAGSFALLLLLIWLLRTSTELSEVASFARSTLLGCDLPVGYDPTRHAVGRHRHLAYVLGEIFTSRVSEMDLSGRSIFRVLLLIPRLMFGPRRKD